MRLHRLIAILLLMESRGVIKARDLAQALETSERTVYRDIDTLCEAGVPITSSSGPAGGFCFMEGYTINMKELHCDDIVNLFLSGIGIRPGEQTEASINLKKTILKLENSLPSQYIPDIRTARKRFYFDPAMWWEEKPPIAHMDLLRRSVWKSKKLNIVYTRSSMDMSETSSRVVCPYGLVVKYMDWYLVAFCEKRNDIRVFKCERITETAILEETFSIPEEFSLESFWKKWTKNFKDIVS